MRIARLPVEDETVVRDQLRHAVRRLGLEPWLEEERCEVGTAANQRRIACAYAVPVEILPGLRRPLTFRLSVEQPFYPATPNAFTP